MPHRNESLPIDGHGGYLWQTNFAVPVYFPDGTNAAQTQVNMTWEIVEEVTAYIARQNVTYSVSFGLVLMTAIHVMALTPSTKRGLPLYTFTMLAIVCELLRLLPEVIIWSRTGYGSFYFTFNGDLSTVQLVAGTVSLLILCQLGSTFAFLFVQFCFFIQAKAVLSSLRITRPRLHCLIFVWLIGFGAFTLAWRLALSIWEAYNDVGRGKANPNWFWHCTDIFYAISIGSWSLIFSIQVSLILYRRARLGGALRRTEALNILLLTGLESMLLPLAACILEIATVSWLPEPEILIMVSVVVIIPFGSLWSSSMQTYDKRSHTFTSSAADNPPPVPPTSDDSIAPAHAQPLDPAPKNRSTHNPRSSSLPQHHGSASRTNSGYSVDRPPRSSGSRTPTSPHNPSRPMGRLEALTSQDLYDEEHETGHTSAYTVDVDVITPVAPSVEYGRQRFPAEHV